VHTTVTFWKWNDHHKDKADRSPYWIAFGAALFYVVIILTVNAALDLFPDSNYVKIGSHALLSLLSVDAAIIIAVRAQHARVLSDKQAAKDERKAQRVATKAQSDAEKARQASVNATNDATTQATLTRQPATRNEFVTAWRDNGHASIAALAKELGVSPRNAQRWIAKEESNATK
jgi:DNA-binding transcriptional regulator YiaG